MKSQTIKLSLIMGIITSLSHPILWASDNSLRPVPVEERKETAIIPLYQGRVYPHPRGDETSPEIRIGYKKEDGEITISISVGKKRMPVVKIAQKKGGIVVKDITKQRGKSYTLPAKGKIETIDLRSIQEHEGLIFFSLKVVTLEKTETGNIRQTFEWPCVLGHFYDPADLKHNSVEVRLNPESLKVYSEIFRTYDSTAKGPALDSGHKSLPEPGKEVITALVPIGWHRRDTELVRKNLERPELAIDILSDLSWLAFVTTNAILMPHSRVSIRIADEPPMVTVSGFPEDREIYGLLHKWWIDIDKREVGREDIVLGTKTPMGKPLKITEDFVPSETRLAELKIYHPVTKRAIYLYKYISSESSVNFPWLTEEIVQKRLGSFEFGFALYSNTISGAVDLSLSFDNISIGIFDPSTGQALPYGETKIPQRPRLWEHIKPIAYGHSHGTIAGVGKKIFPASVADIKMLLDIYYGEKTNTPWVLLERLSKKSSDVLVTVYKLSEKGEGFVSRQLNTFHPAMADVTFERVASRILQDPQRFLVWKTYQLPLPEGVRIIGGQEIIKPPSPGRRARDAQSAV